MARALVDIESSKQHALVDKNQDLRYRQARAVYEKQLANSNKTAWTADETTALVAAFETLRELAVDGYGKALFPLATFYASGWCIEKDPQRASHFFTLAFEWCSTHQSEQDAELWFDLALCFIRGLGVQNDDNQAVYWIQKSAEQSHALAQSELGELYERGRGVDTDFEKAMHWYRKAAEEGNARAQSKLGSLFWAGRYRKIKRNRILALSW